MARGLVGLLGFLLGFARNASAEETARWRFGNGNDKTYATHRAKKLEQIDAWWKAFLAEKDDLPLVFERKKSFDLPGWIREHLQVIDKDLMWEFGPGDKGGLRLVITPESAKRLKPLVDTILERAPKVDGWELHSSRPPSKIDLVTPMLKARGEQPLGDPKVVITSGEHNMLELIFCSQDYQGPEDGGATRSAFLAAEALLGERVLDTWIGAIGVDKDASKGSETVSLADLKQAVDRRIEAIKELLPDKPRFEMKETAGGAVLQLKPKKKKDYPRNDDLLVASTGDSALWRAMHSGRRFYSERFSRLGETFCYLKTDGSVDLSNEKFKDRSDMEDTIYKALKNAKLGAVLCGGTGLRYSYIDLALYGDADRAIAKVIAVLRDGQVVKRSWLLFFDEVYENEWVGIWDDSQPPPGLK